MTKRMIIMLVAVGVLFGGLFGFKAFLGVKIREGIAAKGLPAQTISTAKAQFMEWQGEFQAVGTLRAVRGADIAPEVPGVITAIHFQSGQAAQAGAPLVQLNAESDLARLQSLTKIALRQKITLKSDAFPGQQFTGEVSSIDPKVDPATRNVQVRATVRNPKQSLLPGMFATVAIASGGPQRFLTLPQTAVSYNPFGDTVFVVEEHKGKDEIVALVAQQRFVTTGETRGDQVAILSGIKEGETVVTAGQIKLRTGFPVTVNNSIQPANDPAPKPKDQ